jgi:hypothetical protein
VEIANTFYYIDGLFIVFDYSEAVVGLLTMYLAYKYPSKAPKDFEHKVKEKAASIGGSKLSRKLI